MSIFKYSLNDAISILSSKLTDLAMPIVYMGLVPDFLLRLGIRYRLSHLLIDLRATDVEDEIETKMKTIEGLKTNPTIAIATDEANEQHYEVPAKFYDLCLGPRKKYSSGLWPDRKTTFEESEEIMLDLYCKRAGVQDGMKIVDLGCGWGSLTLWLCEKVSKTGDVVVDPFLFGEKFSSNYIIELFRFVHSTLMLRLQVFPTVILSVNSS